MLGYDHCWALEIRREGGVVVDRDRVRGGSERGYDMVTLVSRDFSFFFVSVQSTISRVVLFYFISLYSSPIPFSTVTGCSKIHEMNKAVKALSGSLDTLAHQDQIGYYSIHRRRHDEIVKKR